MHLSSFLHPALIVLVALSEPAVGARKTSDSVLLTQVKTLTLRKDAKTSHRRVLAIPQLKCVGGNGRGYYEVDVMRCKNQGSDYDDENVQWTCTANLPAEFKLGATDVVCEGYDSPQDSYILKGSCGVEYRLMLTEKGEKRFGKGRLFPAIAPSLDWSKLLFWVLFTAIIGWIVYSAWLAYEGTPRARRLPRNRGFWGGGWGGGGGNDPYDPPPPYPGPKPYSSSAPSFGQEGWRPGFWSGVLGGATAGYLAGNRGGRPQEMVPPRAGGSNWFGNSYNTGVGRLNSRPNPRSNSSSSARYESTGFGSTSRR
jgi:SOCE-associated regulatory factor of calcium homoeostasis